jgi:hypothetical protein
MGYFSLKIIFLYIVMLSILIDQIYIIGREREEGEGGRREQEGVYISKRRCSQNS